MKVESKSRPRISTQLLFLFIFLIDPVAGQEVSEEMKLAIRVVRDTEVSPDGIIKMRLTLPDRRYV
jgi:hypothetical protein